MKPGLALRSVGAVAFDLVAVGENSVDTIVAMRAGVPNEAKQRARSILELPGGQAATAAVACARLGWRSRYVGAIGDDTGGAFVSETLRREGVTTCLAVRPGVPTRRAVVLVDGATGERRVIEYRHPGLTLTSAETASQVYADARILMVDATDVAESTRAARIARDTGVRTIADVDAATDGVADLLRLIDIIVVPEGAVTALSGQRELGRGLAAIGLATGAAAVVATCGADGALAWTPAGEIRSPGCQVTVVDTTGAGDAFRAGLAASWLGSAGQTPELSQLLADANFVGALNCRQFGAQTALPRPDEVPARMRGGV